MSQYARNDMGQRLVCQNACGVEMEMYLEQAHAWCFKCPRCGAARILTKSMFGGTLGAGHPDTAAKKGGFSGAR